MNSKDKSLHKVLAAILVGILLIFAVGIVVNAWQEKDKNENNGDSEGDQNADAGNNTNGENADADKNNDNTAGPVDNIDSDEPENRIPEFTNYLTGLEISEDISGNRPYAFVMEPEAPLYGISSSDITIELPTESGTRFLVYISDTSSLGKIGAFACTRDYISCLTDFFGGILTAYGNDDIVDYSSDSISPDIDLSYHADSIYKENGKNIYSDNKGIEAATNDEGISTAEKKTPNMPFIFADFGKSVSGKTAALTVTLPYSSDTQTTLNFNSESGIYELSKGGRLRLDMLSGENASYKNVFVLFADSITYDMASGTELTIETAKRGSGYYLTDGTLTEIRWEVDEKNNLIFKNLSGEKLTVNRGNSYIGYYKASVASDVIFE